MLNSKRGVLTESVLMMELAEVTSFLSDDEIAAECVDCGEEPAVVASETRGILLKAAKDYRQRYLRAAAEEYRQRISEFSTRWVDLPDTPEERRALLSALFTQRPAMMNAYVTIQHRDFKELSDHDVESCLEQLADLGLLDQEES